MNKMKFAVLSLLVMVMAACTPFPSTNDANKLAGDPYVEVISINGCQITLGFHNPKNYGAGFEVSEDGVLPTSGTVHPLFGNPSYPYIGWEYFSNPVYLDAATFYVERTFTANTGVFVAHSFGAERDHDFIDFFATHGCTAPGGGTGTYIGQSVCGISSVGADVAYLGSPNLPITFYGHGTSCEVFVRNINGGQWQRVVLASVQLSEDRTYWHGLVGFSGPSGALVERGQYCLQMEANECILIEVK